MVVKLEYYSYNIEKSSEIPAAQYCSDYLTSIKETLMHIILEGGIY